MAFPWLLSLKPQGWFWRDTLQPPSVVTLKRVPLKSSIDDRHIAWSRQFQFTLRKTFSTSLTISQVNLYIFWTALLVLQPHLATTPSIISIYGCLRLPIIDATSSSKAAQMFYSVRIENFARLDWPTISQMLYVSYIMGCWRAKAFVTLLHISSIAFSVISSFLSGSSSCSTLYVYLADKREKNPAICNGVG